MVKNEVVVDEVKVECTKIGIWHLIAGIIMAFLGVFIWFNPVATLVAMALYLGIVFIVVGAGYVTVSFDNQPGWYFLVGLLDIFVGVIFVTNLGGTAAFLPIIFALWCLAVGVSQIATAFKFRKLGYSWGWMIAVGLLGVIFAFLILAYPALGTITITALMGAYALLYGIVEIVEYFACRNNVLEA